MSTEREDTRLKTFEQMYFIVWCTGKIYFMKRALAGISINA